MVRFPGGKGRAWALAALALLGAPISPLTQRAADAARADAPLVIDGTVREVFRTTAPGRGDALVQIEVLRAEARRAAGGAAAAGFPAPGTSVYVRVPRPARAAGAENVGDLPAAGAQVRAYLQPGEQGGWQGASADWFELAGGHGGNPGADDPVRDAVGHAPPGAGLGMTTELIKVDRQLVLRVTSVERGGPAQDAGLEVGDVIAAVDGAEIVSENQLAERAARGKKLSLVVIDVNTGRGARVELDPRGSPAADASEGAPAAEPPRVTLGLSAEPVTLGTRSALKVIRVDPAGPAARAGLEPGDILVAANGAPTTGVEQLLSALRKSGPRFTLTVRDARTGRDMDVAVELGGAAPAAPAQVETKIAPAPGTLGAVTELAFHDSDFAVKVTEVQPGSAAARAGLRPGLLVTAADGKPVLHPNDLNDAVRNSSGTLKLTVVDPGSDRKSEVQVRLK